MRNALIAPSLTRRMISKLFKRKLQARAPQAPVVPKGVVVWAVGDIHGRLDLLEPLVQRMIADSSAASAERALIVFLGDYIDRGPQSRGVIQYLSSLPQHSGVEWRFLKGNHEEAMLDFLANPATGPTWSEYGGDATLASYGLRLPQMRHKKEAWDHLSADLAHRLPPVERTFLEDLELSLTVGDYFFAHAGARPGVSLSEQSARDLMWIRGSFLTSEVEFEKVVVHGHTPSADFHVDRRRIGIDTKAYETGVLTALRLSEADRQVVQCVDGVVRLSALDALAAQ